MNGKQEKDAELFIIYSFGSDDGFIYFYANLINDPFLSIQKQIILIIFNLKQSIIHSKKYIDPTYLNHPKEELYILLLFYIQNRQFKSII